MFMMVEMMKLWMKKMSKYYSKNCQTNLIVEEVSALKAGEVAYCFNDEQLKLISAKCEEKGIKFTYEKDEDNFYTLYPCPPFFKY